MKKIKVHYCKYNKTDHTSPQTFNHYIHTILTKHYDVEISDDPEYVFCHGSLYDYLDYKCVRISYTAENATPNFNLFDYAIGNDYLEFGDRYHRLSSYLVATFYNPKELELAKDIDITKPRIFTQEDLDKKIAFCSFVYSNYVADDRRKILFDKISAYKKVDSGGRYLNNIGGPTDNKLGFEMSHKFSMAIENSCRDGYTTDRIVCSFIAGTIPIYWGNPKIGKEFNTKRFINCHDYENFDQVVERIKEIDNNDNLFIAIMNEPLFAPGYSFDNASEEFEVFLKNIFDQPLEEAPRRTINLAIASDMEQNEIFIKNYMERKLLTKQRVAFFYKPFKKIKFFENLKYIYFKKKLKQ